jgi:hypothetical protein
MIFGILIDRSNLNRLIPSFILILVLEEIRKVAIIWEARYDPHEDTAG